jgi:hypothetical protein
MKTTVDIPERALREAMAHTRARTKREAIVTAVLDFNRRKRLEKLTEKLGTLEGMISREELIRVREME